MLKIAQKAIILGENCMFLRKLLLISLVGFSSVWAMKRPIEEITPEEIIPDIEPEKIAKTEAMPQTEADFTLEAMPNEVKVAIMSFLVTAPGRTAQAKLDAAVENIRNFFMTNKAFAEFLSDEATNAMLIDELAKRYTGGNKVAAALALRTIGAGKWLEKNYITLINHPRIHTSFMQAVNTNDLLLVNFILKYIPHALLVNTFTYRGITPIYIAIQNNNSAMIDALIAAGANVNQPTSGITPLMLSIRFGQSAIADKLIAAGADVNKSDNQGITPLMIAAQYEHPDIVEKLLAAQADVTKVWLPSGHTALMEAAKNGNLAIIGQLLKAGANIDTVTKDGSTALMYAIQKNKTRAAVQLINAGADVNKQTPKKLTALTIAAYQGDKEIVERLLAAKANTNGALRTARLSKSPNKEAIIKLLIDHGATE